MLFVPLLLSLSTVDEVSFYVGTYTSKDGSKGIYQARLNTRTGAISEPILAAEAENPSFVAVHPGGRYVYAVHETGAGDVSSYEIGADGTLRHLNTQSCKGSGPCHVSVDPLGKNLLVASYGSGTLSCLPIDTHGHLAEASYVETNKGSGPDKARQEGSHMHSAYANDRFAYACDLGTDDILVYSFDPHKGILTSAHPRSAKAVPGGGPRHIAFGPKGRFAYVNNEMLCSVSAFAIDAHTGALTRVQTLSTLPEGEPASKNSTAEIEIEPRGKWLYVSNRGHDSIAVYTIEHNGHLKLLEIAKTGVKEPRGFAIDPSGRWIVVAGQSSGTLTSLAIDAKNGHLSPSGHTVSVSVPTSVVFARPRA